MIPIGIPTLKIDDVSVQDYGFYPASVSISEPDITTKLVTIPGRSEPLDLTDLFGTAGRTYGHRAVEITLKGLTPEVLPNLETLKANIQDNIVALKYGVHYRASESAGKTIYYEHQARLHVTGWTFDDNSSIVVNITGYASNGTTFA